MASENDIASEDIASEDPVLPGIDSLEQAIDRLEGAVQKIGSLLDNNGKTETSLQVELAMPAENMEEQTGINKESGETSMSGSTTRNRVQEYADLSGKTPLQIPEIPMGKSEQQSAGNSAVPELKISIEEAAASDKQGKQAEETSGEGISSFYNWLMSQGNGAAGNATAGNGTGQPASVPAQTGGDSGGANLTNLETDLAYTDTSSAAGSQGTGTQGESTISGEQAAASNKQGKQAKKTSGQQTGKNTNEFLNWLMSQETGTAGNATAESGTGQPGGLLSKKIGNSGGSNSTNLKTNLKYNAANNITGSQGTEASSTKTTENETTTGTQLTKEQQLNEFESSASTGNDTAAANTESNPLETFSKTEHAAQSVSPSGGQANQFLITFNDGLIRNMETHLTGTDGSVESTDDFLEKLANALQTVLSDANNATM